jgi:hypothetical protein
VFFVSCFQIADRVLVFTFLDGRPNIQASAANVNYVAEMPLKAWVDRIQGG